MEGQRGDARNGEVSRSSGSGSLQDGRGSRTPSTRVAAAFPQSGVRFTHENDIEFRELVAEMEASIRELIELDELGGYDYRRRDEMDEIEQRIGLVITRWEDFIPESVEQEDEAYLRLTQLTDVFLFDVVDLRLFRHRCIRIAEEHVNGDNGNPLSCIICEQVFQLGERARKLPCGHTFHQSCLYEYDEAGSCPCGTILFRQVRPPPLILGNFTQVVPPPLMAGTSISISGDHISDNNSITSICPVCHVDFVLGEDANLLNCGHIHHPNCISKWLPVGKNCPVCRAVVIKSNTSPVSSNEE